MDSQVWQATAKEVGSGLLEGPISFEELPGDALLTKGFLVQEKNKVRPIDDYKENGQPLGDSDRSGVYGPHQ